MKRKGWLWLSIPILLVLLWVFILQPMHRTLRLMKRAGVPMTAVRGVVANDYWADWLCYTDGYDWAILQMDPARFTPPQDWNSAAAPLETIKPQDSERYHYFHWDFRSHPALPETFTAWHYTPVDPLAAFNDQEWFAAMYDEVSGILAIYRGHLLYGMIPGYP